jgi:hypothetical protein
MRKALPIAAAVAALLIVQTPSIAAVDDVTALSGLTVMARRSSTPLSGVDVEGKKCPAARNPADPERQPPKLVSSFPDTGRPVRPGIVILRLTFDQPMTCDGVIRRVGGLAYPCPLPLKSPMISRDRRTFLTVCKVEPGNMYGVVVEGFTSLSGHAFKPRQIQIGLLPGGGEITTLEQAINEDRELRNPRPVKD